MSIRSNRGRIGMVALAGAFVALACLEALRPLRKRREAKPLRQARNFVIAGLGAVSLQVAGAPVVNAVSRHVERRRWGIVPLLRLPRALEALLVFTAMDYTFYLWHVMAHKIPWLWRYHVVHHADLDLDASTALRFHFGELLAGVPFQAAQVVLIGVTPANLARWQRLFLISILFHHSNLRIPYNWERWLSLLIVTPRMHGIHHSIVREEGDSNWSSGLNVWDRLHRTLRLNVPQVEIDIGIPAYRTHWSVRLIRMLRLPFGKSGPYWRFPDGSLPKGHKYGTPRGNMLP